MGKREHLTHSALERQNAALKLEVADLKLQLVEADARAASVRQGDAELREKLSDLGNHFEEIKAP